MLPLVAASGWAQQTVIAAPALPQSFVDVSYFPAVSGTTRTATSCANIQTQLNAAVGGDEVVIPASFSCTGASAVNLSFPNHSGSGYVLVHTNQLTSLPSLGSRTTLQHLSLMPSLTGATGSPGTEVLGFPSSSGSTPSSYWWVTGLALLAPAANGGLSIIQVGDTTGGVVHTALAGVPHHIVIDRCLLLGNPAFNVSQGILAECASCALINSYVDDIHIVGGEGHGWLTTNGPGPFLIENNEIHALAISTFFGGSDPSIAGLVPSDIVIRRNWIQDRPGWDPGINAPAAPGLTANATGGTISCGASVSVQTTLVNSIQGIVGQTTASTATTVTIPTAGCTASGSVSVSTPVGSGDAITGKATGAHIYACTGAACTPTLQLQNQALNSTITLTSVSAGAALPTTNTTNPLYLGTAWLFKNDGEFKNSKRSLIENNVVENTWSGAQCGSLWQFNTASGGSATNENGYETIRYNAVFGQNGLIDGLGGTTGPNNGQIAAHDISIINNTGYNSTGYCSYQSTVGNNAGAKNLNFQHNTNITYRNADWAQVSSSAVFLGASVTAAGVPPVGPTAIHNNILDAGKYGTLGQSCTEGGVATDCYSNGGAYSGTETFYNNALYNVSDTAAACSTNWQTDNSKDQEKHSCSSANAAPFNAPVTNLAGIGFVDSSVGVYDYRLLQSSSFVGAGTDGLDPGADFVGLTHHVIGVSTSLPAKWLKIAVTQVANLGQTSAILKWINFSVSGTADACEFGTTTAYGTACTVTQNGDQNFAVITGLTVSTKYFWRVGGTTGMWGSFVTTGTPPAGRTLALGSTINPASTGTWSLDYGPTSAYGTTVTQSCTVATVCSVLANGVAAGTYHYCARAPGVAACPAGGDKVAVIQ